MTINLLGVLKYAFPALMVVGALGGFVVQMRETGFNATCLQWFGASLLYTALLLRNK